MPAAAWAQPGLSPAQQARAGLTPETAIVLPHITDEFHGVVAEHSYIANHFPTRHLEYQTMLEQNDRRYDVLGMIKPDNTRVALYFDVTGWAGR